MLVRDRSLLPPPLFKGLPPLSPRAALRRCRGAALRLVRRQLGARLALVLAAAAGQRGLGLLAALLGVLTGLAVIEASSTSGWPRP